MQNTRILFGILNAMAYLDELDHKIIKNLQINARQTNRDLAAECKVAPSTALERHRSLERREVINGYHAAINLKAINRGVQALVAISIKPPSRKTYDAFRAWLIEQPEVTSVFVVSGVNDILAQVAVQDTDALYDFVIDGLTQRPEVSDIQSSIIYEHFEKRIIMPLEKVR